MITKIKNFLQNKEQERLKNELENKERIITQLNRKIENLEQINELNYIRADEIYSIAQVNGNLKIRALALFILIDLIDAKRCSKEPDKQLLNKTDLINKSIKNNNIYKNKNQVGVAYGRMD